MIVKAAQRLTCRVEFRREGLEVEGSVEGGVKARRRRGKEGRRRGTREGDVRGQLQLLPPFVPPPSLVSLTLFGQGRLPSPPF